MAALFECTLSDSSITISVNDLRFRSEKADDGQETITITGKVMTALIGADAPLSHQCSRDLPVYRFDMKEAKINVDDLVAEGKS